MELNEYRAKIDALDLKIASLLKERFDLCREIGCLKRCASAPVRDEAREAEVLDAVKKAGGEEAVGVYRAVLDVSRALQENDK